MLGKTTHNVLEVGSVDPSRTPGGAWPGSVEQRKPRMLVVEDDPDSLEVMAELLSGMGYDVKTADSIASAMAIDIESVDVLLTDLGLADGSGLDLLRHLQTRGRIKGIALSGYGNEAARKASRDAGFAAHLTKPMNFDLLIATIDRVFAET